MKNWQNGAMALRWTAAAFDTIAKGFRRIVGHQHLWMLKAALDESMSFPGIGHLSIQARVG